MLRFRVLALMSSKGCYVSHRTDHKGVVSNISLFRPVIAVGNRNSCASFRVPSHDPSTEYLWELLCASRYSSSSRSRNTTTSPKALADFRSIRYCTTSSIIQSSWWQCHTFTHESIDGYTQHNLSHLMLVGSSYFATGNSLLDWDLLTRCVTGRWVECAILLHGLLSLSVIAEHRYCEYQCDRIETFSYLLLMIELCIAPSPHLWNVYLLFRMLC